MSPIPSLHNLSSHDEEWFKIRRYPHFGSPIDIKDKEWVFPYVKSPDQVAKHSFFPFLHRVVLQRKFRREAFPNGSKSQLRKKGSKEREIFYASHLDANVYAYYTWLLSKPYEQLLAKLGLSKCITAYRKIKHITADRNCCNVDFAEEVFEFIRNSSSSEVVAITFDIKKFFDTLDHKILKKAWCRILDQKTLPPDHYQIYKSITRYSFCEESSIFKEFKSEIIVKRADGSISNRSVKKKKYLKDKDAVSFCNSKDFRERVVKKGLISQNGTGKRKLEGIPQGSPISSILANIYLLDFDKVMEEACQAISGLYRRYSDDIVIVCEKGQENHLIELAKQAIDNLKLTIQDSKTQVCEFERVGEEFTCFKIENGTRSKNNRFVYLGFEFDGKQSSLRSASLSKFYRMMKRNLARAELYTFTTQLTENRGKVFRRRLYKRFSYLGSERRRKYVRDKNDPSRFHCSLKYDWGNYLTYAYLAADNMKYSKVRGQVKNHWTILNKEILRIEKSYRASNPEGKNHPPANA